VASFLFPRSFIARLRTASLVPPCFSATVLTEARRRCCTLSGFRLWRGVSTFLGFEGPGQPTVRREQGLGFIADWERVVTPVVSYCEKLSCVDASRIALLGYSFGGFLAPRAAAFEHRLAAVVCIDGLFDIYQAFTGALPAELRRLLDERKIDELNRAVAIGMTRNTRMHWAVEHGCWAFLASTPYEFLERTRTMSMGGLTGRIQCPVLVCEAEEISSLPASRSNLQMRWGRRQLTAG
jgi:pimeloyl-ACP methyl ester carboxylesterase